MRVVRNLTPTEAAEVWPLARVQTAYATTLKVLHELQGIIDMADDDPFWRRRQIELTKLGSDLSTAVLIRKRHSEHAAAMELLGSTSSAVRRHYPGSHYWLRLSSAVQAPLHPRPSEAVDEARAIAEALQRTHDMLTTGLSQATCARDQIEGDGRLLDETFDQHRNIGSKLKRANKVANRSFRRSRRAASPLNHLTLSVPAQLLRRMERQDEIDRWLMLAATVFFAFAVFFVTIPRIPGIVTVSRAGSRVGSKVVGKLGKAVGSATAPDPPAVALPILVPPRQSLPSAVPVDPPADAPVDPSLLAVSESTSYARLAPGARDGDGDGDHSDHAISDKPKAPTASAVVAADGIVSLATEFRA